MNLSGINKKKWIIIFGNGLLILITIMTFVVFLILDRYSNIYEITESANRITIDLNSPFVKGGQILVTGLFCMIISKILKLNILIIGFGILTLTVYYLKMLWIGI